MEVSGMPYKDEFDERDYTVMLEYEQYGKTYAEGYVRFPEGVAQTCRSNMTRR